MVRQGKARSRQPAKALLGRGSGPERRAGFPLQLEQPMRAALLVVVEDLAVVAAHALGLQDLPLTDRAPLAGLLAQSALAALGPAFDRLDRRDLRDEAERRAERAEEPAIEIPHEDARDEQHSDHDPEHGRRVEREQPERLDVAVEPDLVREKIDRDSAEQDAVFDVARARLELRRNLELKALRHYGVDELR